MSSRLLRTLLLRFRYYSVTREIAENPAILIVALSIFVVINLGAAMQSVLLAHSGALDFLIMLLLFLGMMLVVLVLLHLKAKSISRPSNVFSQAAAAGHLNELDLRAVHRHYGNFLFQFVFFDFSQSYDFAIMSIADRRLLASKLRRLHYLFDPEEIISFGAEKDLLQLATTSYLTTLELSRYVVAALESTELSAIKSLVYVGTEPARVHRILESHVNTSHGFMSRGNLDELQSLRDWLLAAQRIRILRPHATGTELRMLLDSKFLQSVFRDVSAFSEDFVQSALDAPEKLELLDAVAPTAHIL